MNQCEICGNYIPCTHYGKSKTPSKMDIQCAEEIWLSVYGEDETPVRAIAVKAIVAALRTEREAERKRVLESDEAEDMVDAHRRMFSILSGVYDEPEEMRDFKNALSAFQSLKKQAGKP